ncbi:MAG: T9SS type A sorting domain-containing protein [Dysgonamonadaceae bacterium]|nr:T9SS type A sorting domain-containing protein [Dysgonamonadaceae bacterium]
MKKIILSICLAVPCLAHAQEVVTTTGGTGAGVIWSVGEVLTATVADAGEPYILTQGFLQPGQLPLSALVYPAQETAPLSAYPNPVTDELSLSASGNWKLYDAAGTLLATGQGATVPFGTRAQGYYLLTLVSGDKIQSIKIIK